MWLVTFQKKKPSILLNSAPYSYFPLACLFECCSELPVSSPLDSHSSLISLSSWENLICIRALFIFPRMFRISSSIGRLLWFPFITSYCPCSVRLFLASLRLLFLVFDFFCSSICGFSAVLIITYSPNFDILNTGIFFLARSFQQEELQAAKQIFHLFIGKYE